MGSIDFQNGFIAGVSTQGAFPLGLRGFKEEDEGKFLKVEDGKVGLGENIELSRVNAQVDSTGIQLEDGQLLEVREGKIVGRSRNEMKNRFFLFIGDSYSVATRTDDDEIVYDATWPYKIAGFLGLQDFVVCGHGGAGFWSAAGDNPQYDFEELLKYPAGLSRFSSEPERAARGWEYISPILTLKERLLVTDIIIGGGYNDAKALSFVPPVSEEYMASRFWATIKDTAEKLYPNAKIHFFSIGWDIDYIIRENMFQLNNNVYYDYSSNTGIAFTPIGQNALIHKNYFCQDGIHPRESGETIIAQMIVNTLLGGTSDRKTSTYSEVTSCDNQKLAGITMSLSGTLCYCAMESINNQSDLNLSPLNIYEYNLKHENGVLKQEEKLTFENVYRLGTIKGNQSMIFGSLWPPIRAGGAIIINEERIPLTVEFFFLPPLRTSGDKTYYYMHRHTYEERDGYILDNSELVIRLANKNTGEQLVGELNLEQKELFLEDVNFVRTINNI